MPCPVLRFQGGNFPSRPMSPPGANSYYIFMCRITSVTTEITTCFLSTHAHFVCTYN